MTAVYALIHLHDFDDGSADFKLIGVFSSREKATRAQAAAVGLPGFRDFPAGFHIEPVEVDPTGSVGGGAEHSLAEELFLLFLTLPDSGRGEEVRILGAFRTEGSAHAAATTLPRPPGGESEVCPMDVDESTWSDGFVTVTPGED
ncbi:hypothetical protein ACFWVC_00080 [Streptomyces sp. NPDC058691]|uniref:DUF7336 domain-containing protein n=1 Tax=Streptomyces sp. NPDC058691 TaxID=3346601 RepID=UPI00365F6DDA